MQNKIYIQIMFITAVIILSQSVSFSLSDKDTMAFIKMYDSKSIDKQTLQFDLYIERKSDRWLKFANGTFALTFDDTSRFKIRPNTLKIQQMRSQLKQDISSGNTIPTTGYRTDFQIYDSRLSITVLGPTNFNECETVEKERPLLIGTFVVSTTEPFLPDFRMSWMMPYTWYQACAFKIPYDSLVNNEIHWFYTDDNVSMEDSNSITYVFVNDTTNKYYEYEDFYAEYVGQMKSHYWWNTKREYNILGYSVYRGLKLPFQEDIDYNELVGTWRQGDKFMPQMVVETNYPYPRQYGFFEDELQFRSGQYCYKLVGTFREQNGDTVDKFIDIACINSPRSIVSSAKASPEVFSSETTVTYTVDDDVYLTAFVTDLAGKELKKLDVPEWGYLDRKEVKRGTYTFKFRAPDLASQGFYNIRFVAYPIKDPTVEESRADVKLQLIK